MDVTKQKYTPRSKGLFNNIVENCEGEGWWSFSNDKKKNHTLPKKTPPPITSKGAKKRVCFEGMEVPEASEVSKKMIYQGGGENGGGVVDVTDEKGGGVVDVTDEKGGGVVDVTDEKGGGGVDVNGKNKQENASDERKELIDDDDFAGVGEGLIDAEKMEGISEVLMPEELEGKAFHNTDEVQFLEALVSPSLQKINPFEDTVRSDETSGRNELLVEGIDTSKVIKPNNELNSERNNILTTTKSSTSTTSVMIDFDHPGTPSLLSPTTLPSPSAPSTTATPTIKPSTTPTTKSSTTATPTTKPSTTPTPKPPGCPGSIFSDIESPKFLNIFKASEPWHLFGNEVLPEVVAVSREVRFGMESQPDENLYDNSSSVFGVVKRVWHNTSHHYDHLSYYKDDDMMKSPHYNNNRGDDDKRREAKQINNNSSIENNILCPNQQLRAQSVLKDINKNLNKALEKEEEGRWGKEEIVDDESSDGWENKENNCLNKYEGYDGKKRGSELEKDQNKGMKEKSKDMEEERKRMEEESKGVEEESKGVPGRKKWKEGVNGETIFVDESEEWYTYEHNEPDLNQCILLETSDENCAEERSKDEDCLKEDYTIKNELSSNASNTNSDLIIPMRPNDNVINGINNNNTNNNKSFNNQSLNNTPSKTKDDEFQAREEVFMDAEMLGQRQRMESDNWFDHEANLRWPYHQSPIYLGSPEVQRNRRRNQGDQMKGIMSPRSLKF